MPNDIKALKARLRTIAGRVRLNNGSFSDVAHEAVTALDQKDARIQELEGALSFYAQIENWNDGILLEHIASSAEADFGQIARAALNGGDGK